MEEKNKKKRVSVAGIIAIVLLLAVIVCAAVIAYLVKTKPFMNFTETTVELGDSVSAEVTDYVILPDFLLEKASLDISAVDTGKVGTYVATVTLPLTTCEYLVHVEDTTPPVLLPVQEELYFARGESYDVNFFAEGATDLSGEVTISFAGMSAGEMLSMEETGEHSVILIACDASGNMSMATMAYEVENPPYFIGVKDNSIKLGSDYNPMDNFVVYDEKFGYLTSDVVADEGGFTTEEEGSYTLKFTVANAHGITARAEETLTVKQQEKTAELGLTSAEVKQLTDLNYFVYEPLTEEDKEAVVSLVEPTLVDLYSNDGKGNALWLAGSGVIYKIDENCLYIGTNHHVMNHMSQRMNNMDVIFFDDETLENHAIPEEIRLNDSDADIAMIKIPVTEVPAATLLCLKQVTYDAEQTTWDSGRKLLAYAKNWRGGEKDLIKEQVLKNWSQYSQSYQDFTKKFQKDYYPTTPVAQGGMSGTGVFDYRGYFMGQVAKSAYAGDNRGDINLLPERLEQLYQKAVSE